MIARFVPIAAAAALVCGFAGPAVAADGIQIVQKVTNGTTVQTFQIQMDNTHMRAEIADAAGRKQVILFDGTRQAVDIVDVERKSYVEMTKADIERVAAQMQGAMATMQQQMANLPPAQRAQMEAMMRGRGMPGAAPASAPAGSAMAAVASTVVPALISPRNCGTSVLATMRLVLGGAASTLFWIDPEKELIGIYLIQLMPANFTTPLQFKKTVYAALAD